LCTKTKGPDSLQLWFQFFVVFGKKSLALTFRTGKKWLPTFLWPLNILFRHLIDVFFLELIDVLASTPRLPGKNTQKKTEMKW
jgi:hypothetical protein